MQAERLFRDFKLGLLALVVLALLLLAYFWDGEYASRRPDEPGGDVLAFSLSGVRRADVMPTFVEAKRPARELPANSPGAPPRRDGAPVATALPPRGWVYVARPGDTLSGIAARFYGDASLWEALLEANRGVLRRPADLRPGMRLVVPAVGSRGPPVLPPLARASAVGAR